MAVDAVVETPFGSAPHECYGLYEPLFEHLDLYAAQIRRDPEEGIRAYLERYVYGPKSWNDYLELLGLEELLNARRHGTSINND
jgi:glutaconate CoA-transferase subunit A